MLLLKLHTEGQSIFAEAPPKLSEKERHDALNLAFEDAKNNALLDKPRSPEGEALFLHRMNVLARRKFNKGE